MNNLVLNLKTARAAGRAGVPARHGTGARALDFNDPRMRRAYFAELKETLGDLYAVTTRAIRRSSRGARARDSSRARYQEASTRLEWLLSVAPPDVRVLLRGAA